MKHIMRRRAQPLLWRSYVCVLFLTRSNRSKDLPSSLKERLLLAFTLASLSAWFAFIHPFCAFASCPAHCQALRVGGMAGLGAAATGGVTTSLFSSIIEGGRHGHSSFSRFCSATRKVLCSATLVFEAALTMAYEVARGRWWTWGKAGQREIGRAWQTN